MASLPNVAQSCAIEAAARILQRTAERASVDPDLRRRLLADPRAVLVDAGLAHPAGVAVEVEEAGDTDAATVVGRISASRVVVPLLPLRGTTLTDEQLDAVVGGVGFQAAALCYAIAPLAAARALVLGAERERTGDPESAPDGG